MRRHWAEYRTTEYADIDPGRTIAILPTAAVEQHGPHLPVGVDAMIAQGMLDRLVADAPGDLDFRILPVQAVGKSNEHLHAPGTLTLAADVAMEAWIDIGLSVARAGVRKLVIVNSHGGNTDMIGVIARELRVRAGMLAVKCHWGAFGHPEGMYPPDELAYGIHGGDMETSLMLHFRPELVDMAQARDFRSSAQDMDGFARLRPTGPAAYGWIASDLNAAGTVGDASAATAAKGAATCAHQVAGFVELLRDVERFDLGTLGNAP
ncbi:creatininase family protein [Rhodobacteraceae bacterium 2CG4]|uniref:Creatininase family protein n=1 Tax=Halovulum marinum TaxID=2662447 RepID=A0A6L5YZ96_9RHOB|nr:creatininase family protein [Halovulum marinum]MSU89165.1 creatininase family protein [Halovulum marinum]